MVFVYLMASLLDTITLSSNWESVASLNGSVVSGSQPDLSLIPQGLCQPKFHQLVAKVSERIFTIGKRKAWRSPVCAGALRLNELHRGHQAAFGSRLVLNHLASKSKISGGFGSKNHLRPDNFPESAVGEGSKLGDAFLAPLNRADRTEKKRLRG